MSDASGILARWRLQLSKFDFDSVHCAGIEDESANVFSRLPTARFNQTKSDDKVPVLKTTPEPYKTVYNNKTVQVEEEPEGCSTRQGNIFSFLPEVSALADRTEDQELGIQDLHVCITAETTDNEFRTTAVTVGQQKTSF